MPIFALADKIDDLLQEFLRARVGILVKDLKTGREIYSRNAKQLMVPASVTKAFTAYSALEYLGADFNYSTKILENKGDIYFKFSGDPSLTSEDLKQLVSKLNKRKISGNIIIDDFIFDQKSLGNGWAWDDNKFCFSASVSAIIIDGNCFKATLEPNGLIKAPKIFAKINNKLVSKEDASCSPDLHANIDNSYDLTGCVNSLGENISLKVAYQNPRQMIKDMLRKALRTQKIKFKPEILFKPAPKECTLIAEHKSVVLAELVKKMMKESNNLYAESFVKTIGSNHYNTQGSSLKGISIIKDIVKIDEMRMVDGSGISRYNLIAPDQLVDLLIIANKNKKIWSYFYDSLAVSAMDGSLEKRFIDHPQLHGRIYAKTGSMSGVSCLMGYLDQDKVFAIMINGFTNPAQEIFKLEEEILKAALVD
jgi:D-alanyl-D-alanine carboxypeptidase/D-alanyl-D-alanine-endopeptidase (penicillin-binding protein 4)